MSLTAKDPRFGKFYFVGILQWKMLKDNGLRQGQVKRKVKIAINPKSTNK